MTEHLVDPIIDLATATGWHVAHARPAKTARGWRTPLTGHAGWPDLALAKHGTIRFLEAKGPTGYPSIEQLGWLRALGPVAAVVRPKDWHWIHSLLTSKPTTSIPSLTWTGTEWTGSLARWATQHEQPTTSTRRPR